MKPADRPYPFLTREELLGRRDRVHSRLLMFQSLLKVAKKSIKAFELGVLGVKGDQVASIPHLSHHKIMLSSFLVPNSIPKP